MQQKNHKIVISDRSFNIVQEVQDQAFNITWEYTRLGGCGSFSFDLPIKYCSETTLGMNYNVKIYWRNPTTKTFTLVYQGRIEDKIQNVANDGESITLQGMGYQSALSDIFINKVYTAEEVSLIITDIIENTVSPNTNIIYDGTKIAVTDFTPSSWPIATDALSAIQALSDLVGTCEWGVDVNRKFFFIQRSSTIGFQYPLGVAVQTFSDDNSTKQLVNHIVVIGGTLGDGSTYTKTFDYAVSQAKWGRRDISIQNSSIITDDVSLQFANALYNAYANVSHSASIGILNDTQIEATIPIPLVQLRPKIITYGTSVYSGNLYSGLLSYQVNRIQYKLDDTGSMSNIMQIGTLIPSIAEAVKGLEYTVSQIQQAVLT